MQGANAGKYCCPVEHLGIDIQNPPVIPNVRIGVFGTLTKTQAPYGSLVPTLEGSFHIASARHPFSSLTLSTLANGAVRCGRVQPSAAGRESSPDFVSRGHVWRRRRFFLCSELFVFASARFLRGARERPFSPSWVTSNYPIHPVILLMEEIPQQPPEMYKTL